MVLNVGTPVAAFLQTEDMLALSKLYGEVVLISVSKKRKNKYGLFIVHFTGISNYGRSITFGLGFLDIKCVEAYKWIFEKYLDSAIRRADNSIPRVVVTNIDQEIIQAKERVFTTSLHIINQYYFLQAAAEVCKPHHRRADFDFPYMKQMFAELVTELNRERFEEGEREIR